MKMRTLAVIWLLITSSTAGCSNMMSARAIDSFAQSLEDSNVEELRATTSQRFEQQALRLPEAVEDFRILDLPTGETTVLSVDDVSDTMKHVTVEIGEEGEDKETLEYHLTREDDDGGWVVDDIYMTQQSPGSESSVTRSVTEQMDLLLSVREFLAAWQGGDREEILDVSTADFQSVLSEVPPAHLHHFTQHFVDGIGVRALRPQARMQEALALVVVPATRGNLMIQFEYEDGRWRVANLVPDSAGETERLSALKLGAALSCATRFLKAYERGDRRMLSELAAPEFFERSLVAADLTSVPLPVTQMMAVPYEFHFHNEHIDLVLPTDTAAYVLTLDCGFQNSPLGGDSDASSGTCTVSEVTIYETETGQVKRVSSMFTAQAVVELYAEALAAQNLASLMALSTGDFNDRAWSQVDAMILNALPLSEIEAAPPRLAASVFKGPAVEMTVTQGSHALTYVLRASQGRMLVDDVLLPVTHRPGSLKANIEVLAPMYAFARGIHQHDLDMLRRHSGSGLDRKVWSQTTTVPDVGFAVSDHLLLPIRSIQCSGDQAIVSLTDGTRETQVNLVREHSAFVVQDVQLSAGDGNGQQITLLQEMRDLLARQFDAGAIIPAGYETTRDQRTAPDGGRGPAY